MKNLTAVLLAFLIVVSAFGVSAYSSGGFKNGDVDRNGRTKIQDANLIQRSIAGLVTLDEEQTKLADYNLDGKVNISDVTEIQFVLAECKPEPTEPTETQPETQATTATQPTTETQPATQPATAPNPEVNSTVKVYFTNNKNWDNVYFYLYDYASGTPKAAWPGTKVTNPTYNNGGEQVYSMDVDTSKYDRIIFNNGTHTDSSQDRQTVNVAVNKASSGFFIYSDSEKKANLVGTYAYTGADSGSLTELSFDYPGGYKKKVWIWTPADYKATGDKFRTIYLTDGQNIFDKYQGGRKPPYGGWEVSDAVESMMANGGRGVILVGIENTTYRDNELTPDLGEINPQLPASDAQSFKNGNGAQFADFVANTVMPYVQENYNSSTAKCDNMICGSSSGGIESFYIGMEYHDKFGMIGALSPAFLLFDDTVWNSYLSKYDLTSDEMPKLYMFNGNNDELEQNLNIFCVEMYNRLKKAGYKKMVFIQEQDFKHNEAYWRIIFPECISWLLEI